MRGVFFVFICFFVVIHWVFGSWVVYLFSRRRERRLCGIFFSLSNFNFWDLMMANELEIQHSKKLAFFFILGVTVCCVAPFVLNLISLRFGIAKIAMPWGSMSDATALEQSDAMFHSLKGGFVHTILEWSAFCAALFTLILSFAYYRIKGDAAVILIGLAIFYAGCMDAFHTFAADRLIHAHAPNNNLIPFTWAICRIFKALIMIVGVAYVILRPKNASGRRGNLMILFICVGFALIAYEIIHLCAGSRVLPQTMYHDSIIARPFDMIPLFLFAIFGTGVYYWYYKKSGSIFALSLLISVIPDVVTQLHMTFGSDRLFDNHFNIAHFLKIGSYLVPMVGLVVDYVLTYEYSRRVTCRLEDEVIERKRTQVSLLEAKTAAESASRFKSEFLANMSHEIRTPMTAIVGFSNLMLKNGDDRSNITNWSHKIYDNAEHLLDLVNDILDVSKIEAGQMKLELTDCDLGEVLMTVDSIVAPMASKKDISFSIVFHNAISRQVVSDALRIKQVLINLINNAIKFTERGGVTLIVETCDSPTAGKTRFVFKVQDTGIGIPGDKLPLIFQSFRQVQMNNTRNYGGTGLGLNISKQLAYLLAGDITVESEPGEGSCFTFYIEIDNDSIAGPERIRSLTKVIEEHERRESSVATYSLVGFRILVVDDNIDNQNYIGYVLKQAGGCVVSAENGAVSIQRVNEANDRGEGFHVIVMDMQMPIMDGYEATAKIREMGETTPIVALTANVMSEDKERCFAAGANEYLSKPILPDNFVEVLYRFGKDLVGDVGEGDVGENGDVVGEGMGESGQVLGGVEKGACAEGVMDLAMNGKVLMISEMVDDKEFASLLKMYLDGLVDTAALLRGYCVEEDLDEIKDLSHKISGAGSNYGFPEISEIARRCEHAIMEGKGIDEIGRCFEALVDIVESALPGEGRDAGRGAA